MKKKHTIDSLLEYSKCEYLKHGFGCLDDLPDAKKLLSKKDYEKYCNEFNEFCKIAAIVERVISGR